MDEIKEKKKPHMQSKIPESEKRRNTENKKKVRKEEKRTRNVKEKTVENRKNNDGKNDCNWKSKSKEREEKNGTMK